MVLILLSLSGKKYEMFGLQFIIDRYRYKQSKYNLFSDLICEGHSYVVANSESFGLILNIAKTKVMVFAKKHTPITITVKGEGVQK